MIGLQYLKSALVGGASVLALAQPAAAKIFNIPDGDLATALSAYMQQSGVDIVYLGDVVRGHRSHGAKGDYTETAALTQILRGTGFTAQAMAANTIGIVPQKAEPAAEKMAQNVRRAPSAAAAPSAMAPSAVETVVVTAQKKSENIQNVPIAVTALSQAQLTERQIAGGPDLVKEVPNLTFSKTNFTGYNLEIRGIGTQAISVTTDPAVAVAFNSIPFIRNHFFEQEFYDLEDVEVLRGPQGTLYGRNATAGVVNVVSAKPTDQFEAMLSGDIGNFNNRRLEGMVNIPIVGDKLDLRMAGEWTKRDGYTFDQSLGRSVDGRDLWSGRVTLSWKPIDDLQIEAVWEHFQENDDRVRSAKQLCKKDPGPTNVDGLDVTTLPQGFYGRNVQFVETWLSQGCLPTSLYSPDAFETPNGQVLPFVALGEFIVADKLLNGIDPYADQTQSTNLRVIESLIKPSYRAKNDTLELNAVWSVTPELQLTSQTGYNDDFLFSTEDFNRFNTAPGIFNEGFASSPDWRGANPILPGGVYCDPQLGCSSSMVGQDLSQEHAFQFSQELRLASNFDGPLNFSFGTNYMHYRTVEDYFVFFNLITAELQVFNGQDAGQFTNCDSGITNFGVANAPPLISPEPVIFNVGNKVAIPSVLGCNGIIVDGRAIGTYIDTNPISSLDGQGHNYFRSENPYDLNSYAGFGEVYYRITPDLKLTGGLRWTDDQKTFWNIPSWVFEAGGGYPLESIIRQGWNQWTGRLVADWTPTLDFTDQTLIYGSFARGYKGGGANPPGPVSDFASAEGSVAHPLTFAPEFINAYELGTKNSLLGGSLTLNGDIFYYDYKNYQISQIVDRTSINLNFSAKVEGAELEAMWEPMPGLKFNFAGGVEDTSVNKGQSAIDLMDRTAGQPGWMIVKPYVDETSNCILPTVAVKQIIETSDVPDLFGTGLTGACDAAYHPGVGFVGFNNGLDIAAFNAVGFNPLTAPNNGEGFSKDLGGKKLPNSPPFTLSLGGEYTMPVGSDWAATLHTDFYWQGNSWARIFNDRPYDKLRGYTNVNLALTLTSADGWEIMAYVKNVFDTTAITGAFLNSDDTALTTNVFLTDPRLFGVRLTKRFSGDGGDSDDLEAWLKDAFGGLPPLWIEIDGQWAEQQNDVTPNIPAFMVSSPFGSAASVQKEPQSVWDRGGEISFQPTGSDWVLSAAIRYGKSSGGRALNHQTTHASHPSFGVYDAYQHVVGRTRELHTITDFKAGKDIGLGMFAESGSSLLSAGLRIAQFTLDSDMTVLSQPTNINGYGYYHIYRAKLASRRRFTGIGPSLSWDASAKLMDETPKGSIDFDWGVNGAILFGRQREQSLHQTTNNYKHYFQYLSVAHMTASATRSHRVTVPNLGGFAGISWHYGDAKVSFGYRIDEFFGAMDGGNEARKSENVGFYGPFVSVKLGLGG